MGTPIRLTSTYHAVVGSTFGTEDSSSSSSTAPSAHASPYVTGSVGYVAPSAPTPVYAFPLPGGPVGGSSRGSTPFTGGAISAHAVGIGVLASTPPAPPASVLTPIAIGSISTAATSSGIVTPPSGGPLRGSSAIAFSGSSTHLPPVPRAGPISTLPAKRVTTLQAGVLPTIPKPISTASPTFAPPGSTVSALPPPPVRVAETASVASAPQLTGPIILSAAPPKVSTEDTTYSREEIAALVASICAAPPCTSSSALASYPDDRIEIKGLEEDFAKLNLVGESTTAGAISERPPRNYGS